jgi:putative membrane protein
MLNHFIKITALQYILLSAIYSIGLYQYSVGRLELFTPWFYLLLACILVISSIRFNIQAFIFIGFIIIFSIIASIIGANTDQVFGSLNYGNGLGLKIFETPIAIGALWIVIILGSISISQKTTSNKILTICNATMITTIFNVLFEPLAVRLDYWTWEYVYPSMYNYISWLILALIFCSVGVIINACHKNSLAGINLIVFLLYLLIIVR